MNKELLFTGYYSVTGEKIYLGDKLRNSISGNGTVSFVIQYDDVENEFFMIPNGRDVKNLPFRKYPLKGNLDTEYSRFHVVGNVIIPENPKVGERVRITVFNKGENFPFGSLVTVLKIEEWSILVQSESEDEEIVLNFGEFVVPRL